jgi:hypothetical protein
MGFLDPERRRKLCAGRRHDVGEGHAPVVAVLLASRKKSS